jgi:hypothetical protein
MMTMGDLNQARFAGNGSKRPSYQEANKSYPTPQARDWKGKTGPAFNHHTLPDEVGGSLNPPWVEWLMGWLIEWTDLKPLEMDKFQQWQQQHGGF